MELFKNIMHLHYKKNAVINNINSLDNILAATDCFLMELCDPVRGLIGVS